MNATGSIVMLVVECSSCASALPPPRSFFTARTMTLQALPLTLTILRLAMRNQETNNNCITL